MRRRGASHDSEHAVLQRARSFSKGRTYVWGWGRLHELTRQRPHDHHHQHFDDATPWRSPQLVEAVEAHGLRGLSCGRNHAAAVTNSGALYSWHERDDEQKDQNDTRLFGEVNTAPEDTFAYAECGRERLLTVTVNGRIIEWCTGNHDADEDDDDDGGGGGGDVSMTTGAGCAVAETLPSNDQHVSDDEKTNDGKPALAPPEAAPPAAPTPATTVEPPPSPSVVLPLIGKWRSHVISCVFGSEMKVMSRVSCGGGFAVAISVDGVAFAWGRSSHGRLGLGAATATAATTATAAADNHHHHHQHVHAPQPILLDGGEVASSVACGWSHTVLATGSGRVYTWGCALGGRLGHGSTSAHTDDVCVPTLVDALASHLVVDVACGYHHSLVRDVDGHLYVWGGNEKGQLGVGDTESRAAPVRVHALRDKEVVKHACGAFHNAGLLASGVVYTWGWGKYGQLGLGHEDTVIEPALVTALDGLDVQYIACGGEYTICVTDHFMIVQQDYFTPEKDQDDAAAASEAAALRRDSDSFVAELGHPLSRLTAQEQPQSLSQSQSQSLQRPSSGSGDCVVRKNTVTSPPLVTVTEACNTETSASVSPQRTQSHRPSVLDLMLNVFSRGNHNNSNNNNKKKNKNSKNNSNSSNNVNSNGVGNSNINGVADGINHRSSTGDEGNNNSNGIDSNNNHKTSGTSDDYDDTSGWEDVGDDGDYHVGSSNRSPMGKRTKKMTNASDRQRYRQLVLAKNSDPNAQLTSPHPSIANEDLTQLSLNFRPVNLPPKTTAEAALHRREVDAMSRKYKEKLRKEAMDKALNREKDRKRRKRDERDREVERQKILVREAKRDDLARLWLKKIIPKWNKPGTLGAAKELAWKDGIPAQIRGKVWPLVIGNSLMITRELYEIFRTHAADARSKKKQQDTAALAAAMAAVDAPSSPTPTDEEDGKRQASPGQGRGSIFAIGRETTFSYIDVDLARTFPSLAFFQEGCPMHGQLREILETFCFYRPDIGYIQGMSYLAGNLLLQTDPFTAFVCFANLLNSHFFHGFLRLDHEEMEKRYLIFSEVFKSELPKLHQHFEDENVLYAMYFLEWCMTLFTKRLSLDVVGRVWDCYLFIGETIVYRTAVSILKVLHDKLIDVPLDKCVTILHTQPQLISEDDLFKAINSIKLVDRVQKAIDAIQEK